MKSKEKTTNKEAIERLKEIICAIMLYVTEAKLDKEEIENELLNVKILEMAIEALQQERPKGEWVEVPHEVFLPRDCFGNCDDPTYNEKNHSIIEQWWHCSECEYEASREIKPIDNFCPNCGADMRGEDNDN